MTAARASTAVAAHHNDNERPGWASYVLAIVVSALGHAGFLAFALLILPNWLHSATIEPPNMTVKIVDNIPAGDLGTHLPKLAGHKKPEPEQVAKAEVKPETPPPLEEKPPPPEEKPPPAEPPKPENDKNAVSLNSTAPTPTPTPEPPPAVAPATPEPTPTETPKKVTEPAPTPKPPEVKPHRHEKVIAHNPPKAKHTPIQMAKAESTPDVHEQFRKLQQEMLKRRIADAGKAEDDSADDDDSETESTPPGNDSGERGPVASNANSGGSGSGIGSGTGSMGKVENLQYLLYYRTVQQKVKEAWTFPGGSNDLSADVEFSIGADGTLNGVKIAKSSGDGAFDESVVRAIRRAAPFPPPPDQFRTQFSDVVSTFKLGELKS
jgi:protein TonB